MLLSSTINSFLFILGEALPLVYERSMYTLKNMRFFFISRHKKEKMESFGALEFASKSGVYIEVATIFFSVLAYTYKRENQAYEIHH